MKERKINVLRNRSLSLEGASLIGTGACCKVYLLPDENVVKVLFKTDFKEAEREILLSKWAFGKGLPTAISYDVVNVDGHPGLVYESLGRDNLRNHLRDDAENQEQLLEKYLSLIRSIDAIEVEPGQLPSAKEKVIRKVAMSRKYFSDDEYEKISALLKSIPDSNHMVHGDCHIKNIKIVHDEPYLIDLDTLAIGDPIFELCQLCCCYDTYAWINVDEKGYNFFFELDHNIVEKTYHYIVDNYYPGLDEETRKSNLAKVELLTYLDMLDNFESDSETDKMVLKRLLECIRERLPVTDNLILQKTE